MPLSKETQPNCYIQKSLLIYYTFQTQLVLPKINKWMNEWIKTPWAYEGNINRILSGRWLGLKCIKHVTAQVGSIRLKYKNKSTIKKKSLFQLIMNFLPKFFGADSIPYMAIK